MAWIRATSADPQLRDGAEAVRAAERACRLAKWKGTTVLNTLAAAYAEAGRFKDAVSTARTAIAQAESANRIDIAAEIRLRLELYLAGKPYREKPQKTSPAADGRSGQ